MIKAQYSFELHTKGRRGLQAFKSHLCWNSRSDETIEEYFT